MSSYTAALRQWLKFSNFFSFIFRKFRTEWSISNIKITSSGKQENKTNLYIYVLFSTTCSDFIHKHNCKNCTTLSLFWENNAWWVEKITTTTNGRYLETNRLTAHIPLLKHLAMPCCSPSHFSNAIFSVNLWNNLEPKSLKLFSLRMWLGKDVTF